MMVKLKFVDVFSGIGGLRQGFEKNGHECIAFSEIDKHAIKSYKAIYGDGDVELGDISVVHEDKLKELGKDVDLVVGGSPCTAFSIAGKKGGFEDTRGSLFFEYCRTLKYMQPKYFLFENVKGVLSHDQGRTIDTMIRTFNEVGYTVDLNLVNSKYFGVPQHRERIFVTGVRSDLIKHESWLSLGKGVLEKARQRLKDSEDIRTFNFDWPKQGVVKVKLKDVLETNVHDGYYINEEKAKKLIGELKSKDIDNSDVQYLPTLTPDRVERRQMGRRFKEDGDPAFTLTALDRHGVTEIKLEFVGGVGDNKWLEDGKSFSRNFKQGNRIYSSEGLATTLTAQGVGSEGGHTGAYLVPHYRIRRLTPLETWRLQGFSDKDFYKAQKSGVSDSQLYKQAGNAVTVNVIDAIAKKMNELHISLNTKVKDDE